MEKQGAERFFREQIVDFPVPGIVIGLCWVYGWVRIKAGIGNLLEPSVFFSEIGRKQAKKRSAVIF